MRTQKIKPCPYCGGKAYLDFEQNENTDSYPTNTLWAVVCDQCGAILYPFQTKEDAVNGWNAKAEAIERGKKNG